MVRVNDWGALPNGGTAHLYEMADDNGLTVTLSDYGGIITSIMTPDRNGGFADIVLGYNTLGEYVADDAYLGAMIGRYANRIKNAEITINDVNYKLTKNEGDNQLHGGGGFHKRLWAAEMLADGVSLRLRSPDGEDGFPGNVDARVDARLTGDRLTLEFTAVSDKDTVVSMTNHAYFNLRGHGDILGHWARIDADSYTPGDDGLIPTGEINPVHGTDMDFRVAQPIEKGHYDHNFVLRGGLGPAAEIYEPETGRILSVYTTLPGAQFYCGGSLTPRMGKNGIIGRYGGFCVEPQFFPNTPNTPGFPGCVLKAGEVYSHKIVYVFAVEPA